METAFYGTGSFCWLFFKSAGKKNYGKEAVSLLLQYYYIFSERQKHQLLWSRCVNTKGYEGTNIQGDYHMGMTTYRHHENNRENFYNNRFLLQLII